MFNDENENVNPADFEQQMADVEAGCGQVGVGTVISGVGVGTLFNLNFALLRFKAADVRQENLPETIRRLRGTKED